MKKLLFLFAILFLFFAGNSYSQIPFKFGASIGPNFPNGTFGEVYKSGISAEVIAFYGLPAPGLDLTLSAGVSSFTYKNDYFINEVKSKLLAVVNNFEPDWGAMEIPILIGIRYRVPSPSATPYVSGEVGVRLMSFSDRFSGAQIIANSSNPTSITNLTNVSESKMDIGFGGSLGAGVEIPILPKVDFDMSVKYNYSSVTFSKSYNFFRNNNSQYTSEELKGVGYFTFKGGVKIGL